MPNDQQICHDLSLAGSSWYLSVGTLNFVVPTVTLRFFASAREVAGTDRAELEVNDVAAALDWARNTFGEQFAAILDTSRIWLNGEAVQGTATVSDGDEIAVLPPVSGGA